LKYNSTGTIAESVNVYNFVHLVEVKVDSCSYFTYGADTSEHFEKKETDFNYEI